METDENRRSRVGKKVKTDEFRLCENRFGNLREETPVTSRNAKELGIISLWSYSKTSGYHCYHSFYVANPFVFRTESEGNHINKTILYVGHNHDVFFFNENEKLTMRGMTSEYHRELYL